jgi:hypothetical protein
MQTFYTYGINKKYVTSALFLNIIFPIVLAVILGIYILSIRSSGNIYRISNIPYLEHIIPLCILILLLIIDISINRKFDVIYTNVFLYAYIIGYIGYGIYNILALIVNSPLSISHPNSYENFADVNGTLQQVQQATQLLQKSLTILNTTTDDTCVVIKGIEQKFLDNATAPSGDGENPPSPAEAKELKAKALPGAIKQWNKEKESWSSMNKKIPVVECFDEGSLNELITANQELSDLLESTAIQKINSLQTSNAFAQKYMNNLAAKLTGESFVNPTPEPTAEDTIATSNKLIKRANDVQSKIQGIVESTKQLKQNYIAMNKMANDPNTVNNLAEKKL